MEKQITEEKIKMSKHEFYFETPLYEVINSEELEKNIFIGDVDAYNSTSGFETTYKIEAEQISDNKWSSYYKIFFTVTLTCKRNEKDKLRFFILDNNKIVVKLGQLPSLADIQFAEIGKKYDKFLSREDLKEFKKAIGLAAHGIGAGSFVYLRRIFENLIFGTFNDKKVEVDISEEDFLLQRMAEKIDLLKKYLPSQLIEMKSAYSILSKGVHELSEQECLKYFPVLKLSIELILEQKIEMDIKKKRDDEVKKQLASLTKSLGNK